MAQIPSPVQRGDLITAEWMNQWRDKLIEIDGLVQQLSGSVGSGTVTVPNVFGRTLSAARAILTQPAQQLALGSVIDAFGVLVNPSQAGAGALVVLSQVPVAGARTFPGAAVNLVVAAQPGSSSQPAVPPQINQIVPGSQTVGGPIQIRGSGFQGSASGVTLDNIPAQVLATSTITTLFLTVPPGIPGAPTAPGQAGKPGVVVTVTNPDATFATSTMTVTAPLANPLTLGTITPNPASGLVAVTIPGAGFSTTAAQNQVRFDGVLAAVPSSATATQLVVTVPSGIPGLVVPGDSKTVNVTVTRTTDSVVAGPVALQIDL
jgi:hypothetical protein